MALSKQMGKIAVSFITAALIAGVSTCYAANSKGVKDYTALALEKSPSMTLAKLSLQESELDLTNLRLDDSILSIKQLEIQSKKASRAFDAAKRQIALDVENSYIGVLKAQKSLEMSKASTDQAKAQLAMVKARFDQKVNSKLDLINAQKQARSAEINLRRAGNDLEKAKATFKELTGTTDEVSVEGAVLETTDLGITLDQAVALAVQSSPDIEYAKYDLELATIQKNLKDNDFTTPNEKKKAEISLTRAQLALDSKQQSVVQRAKDLYLNVATAQDQILISKDSVESATEQLRVTTLRYNAGMETMSTLINVQMGLDKANLDLLDSNINLKMAVSSLLSFIGKI